MGLIGGGGAMTYAAELSREEQQQGFIHALVTDPLFGEHDLRFVPAVLYRVREGERVIKLCNGQHSHQLFGRFVGTPGKHQAEWLPISGPHSTPQLAVEMLRADGNDPSILRRRIQTALPTLLLRCPKCSAKFKVNADHLPINGTQTCPSPTCRITGPNEAFAAQHLAYR
jgi:predicted Zn finger-like uncharacterized protein